MKVLVVDDDKFIQTLIANTVTTLGHEALISSNGKEALGLINKNDEALLAIVDWMMPVMDGLQLCKKIRSLQRQNYIYVLMLTAKHSEEDIVEGFKAGVDDYLVKPFERQEFKSRLNTGVRILQNEMKLIDNHNYLLQTIDSLGECLIRTDNEGQIEYFNQAACSLTGYKNNQLKGLYLKDVLHLQSMETNSKVSNPLGSALINKKSFEPQEKFILIDKFSKKIPVKYKIKPLFKNPNETIGFVCVIHDQSEETEIEEQLKQSSKMETIGKLAGGIAHDFNNMLGGIIGYSEMLVRRVKDDEKSFKYANFVLQTARRSSTLISKLLAFARKRDYTPVPVDLHLLIDEAITLLSCSTEKEIRINCELTADMHYILGEPTQLQNVLLNLGVNSFDAIEKTGSLEFKTKNIEIDEEYINNNNLLLDPGLYIQITTKDTGSGMDDETIKKIFDPFFTTKEEGKGTGLGLASVKKTILDHKGSMVVRSKVGEGSSFEMLFPVSTKKKNEIDYIENDIESGSGRILIVDDELVIREMASDLLKGIGYEVVTAENGVEALEIYQKEMNNISLVLLDVIMPKMGGAEAFKKLKELNNDVNIVVTSGFAVDDEIKTMLENGAKDFIKKPYYASSFSQKIAKSINQNFAV